ncbi:MAG TPA: alpha-2-macroglobulin family protein [Spirochaetia bacterium]|nr:alpha-2-macroglobulin family protein [Spirochaetia bacterium]
MKRLSLFVAVLAAALLELGSCAGPRQEPPAESFVTLAAYTPAPDDQSASRDAGQDFTMAETGPSGTVPHENLEGGVWVLFSKPVVPLRKLEKPATSSGILSISPRVDGIFRWYGSRLLSFEPKGQLAPATEYVVKVSKSLKSLDGQALGGDTEFRFRTEPLGIVSLSPQGGDVIPEASAEIVVTFNFPVDLPVVVPFIRLTADGADVRFRAARPKLTSKLELGPYENTDRLVSLTPDKPLPRNADVKVVVLAGAKPKAENYGTSEALSAGFHTLLPLEIEDSEVSLGGPAPSVVIRFNHALQAESVLPNLRVPVRGYVVAKNMEVSGSWLYLNDVPVPFESTIQLQVLRGITDVYGQTLGEDRPLSLNVGAASPFVAFRATGQKLLESQFPPRVAVEFQNVISGKFGMGSLTDPFGQGPGEPKKAINIARVPRNKRHFEIFDLAPVLNSEKKGAAWLSWSFMANFNDSETPEEARDSLVVQVTDIGASLHVAHDSLVVMAGSLSSGAPLVDADVSLLKGTTRLAAARTDATGLAALTPPPGTITRSFLGHEEDLELQIAKGKDRLVLRPAKMPCVTWNSSEPYNAEKTRPLTYMWSDRGIYRPGETVSFAGIDQDLVVGRFSAVPGKFRVDFMKDSEDSEPVASFRGTASASGSFAGQVKLPADLEPGDWFLSFHRLAGGKDQGTGQTWVKVANFRRVTFSVDLSLPDQRTYMGGALEARFAGKYLAGGNVSRGKWSWFWTRREIWYQPPGDAVANYAFGAVSRGYPEDLGSANGTLSADGMVVAPQKLADGDKGRVYSYEVSATVEDIDRQAISRSDARTVFSSEQMLGGLLSSSPTADDSLYFVEKEKPFTLKVVSVDPDGKPYPSGDVAGRLLREDWKLVRERAVGGLVDTHYEREEVVEKEFTVRPARPFGSISLATEKSGSYVIELSGSDTKGRQSFTRLSFYSTGSDFILWNSSDERQIEIVPDKKVYSPGDKAKLLIKSPVPRGMFLITIEREGIIEQRAVQLEGSAPTIDVDVKEGYVPTVYVFVCTSLPRTKPPSQGPDVPDFGKPRGYSGLVEIPVRLDSRTIHVDVTPSKNAYRPGTQASVKVKATWNGKPLAGAEIALVAADRGVLDLIDYHVPNPVDFFYSRGNFGDRVAHYESRDLLLDPVTWKSRDLPGGDEKGEAAPETGAGVNVRKNFNPTAVFRTGLKTAKDGTVTVTFTLPDLLTKFRTTAVASKDNLFGIAEGELLVQNPINVRTALPRRMRVGDAATAGVVLTNLDSRSHAVTVSAGATPADKDSVAISFKGPTTKKVQLAAGDTAEVAFDLGAPGVGTSRLAFDMDSDILKERLEDSLAVASDHVNEAFTIIGKTTNNAQEALTVPSSFLGAPEEGLYLTLDSTIASALAGAVRFLDLYPYDCLEQVTSKLFARVLFPDLAGAPPDLGTIVRFANPDGGFSYWDDPPPRRSGYYVSLRVAHLLAAAQSRGIDIPEKIDTEALLSYLSKGWDKLRDTYLQAYTVYVFSLYGRKEKAKADSLLRLGDRIGIFGYGFLGLAYQGMGDQKTAGRILERMKNFVRVGTRTVTLVGTVNDWMWYGGNLQAKALLLMLYARLQPDSQLVLGLANDLLSSNTGGYWGNTSNAGWVLQAFAELIAQNKENEADFTAKVTLGGNDIAGAGFKGFSKAPFKKQVPAADLSALAARQPGAGAAGAQMPLSFGLTGTGTLYYTAELRYALDAGSVDPRDEGIGIAAEITDAKGAIVDGTTLKLGQVYRMRLVFYSSRDRTFLALRAPIPSGAEPIDGSLATSQIVKPPAQQVGSDNGDSEEQTLEEEPGYTTRIYDNEVRFFFDQVDRGKHEVSFLFRTTTPGAFPTPPVQAELMYQPEVFGRTSGAVFTIAP